MTNDVPESEVRLLLESIYDRYHYDFRGYSYASIQRRIEQAMKQLDCRSISHLQKRVTSEPETFTKLLSYLTVQVSEMFRNPSFFLALREMVIPYLKTYPSTRIWVAGCSAGEEAYSVAILLREEGLLDRSLIYATDINPTALERARAGIYSLDRVAQFSESYRQAGGRGSLVDYYTAAYGSAVLDKSLRDNIVFSDHSLTTDGVFAEVQLVLCRNVLIYFDRTLQDRAIGLFRDALCHKGFLGLGAKESIAFSMHAAAFRDVARHDRIFQKR